MKRVLGFVFVFAMLALAPLGLTAQETPTPAVDTALPPELVWQIYLHKQSPTVGAVGYLLEDPTVAEKYKIQATEWLLSQHDLLANLNGSYALKAVICFVPEPYKQRAWTQLKLSQDHWDFMGLLYAERWPTSEGYKNAVIEELWKRSLGLLVAMDILHFAPRMEDRERAADMLLTGGSDIGNFAMVVISAPRESQKSEGWAKLVGLLYENLVATNSEPKQMPIGVSDELEYGDYVQTKSPSLYRAEDYLGRIEWEATEPYRTKAQRLLKLLRGDENTVADFMRQSP